MIGTLARHWWVVLVRGIAAIAFGLMAYAWPGVTIAILVTFWGAYMLLDGIFEVVAGVKAKYGSLVLLGVLGIAAGLVALVLPVVAAGALVYIIAFWAIVAGVMQIAAAVRLRKEVQGEWLWILSGVCTVALGCLLFARPGAGALSLVWLIASFAIAWGILL
ncbi:MAG TPA: HdeD family acid-resistance protein, partial [Thermoanaerobaculia bacterium]